jgi:hypothetical protein
MEYITVASKTRNRRGNPLTIPIIYGISLLETFIVSGFPAFEVRATSSSVDRPTRAIPSTIPIVAGIPPFLRTIDSSSRARATLSG